MFFYYATFPAPTIREYPRGAGLSAPPGLARVISPVLCPYFLMMKMNGPLTIPGVDHSFFIRFYPVPSSSVVRMP
ncbi:MAG: hypothetical protein OP8BY_0039 [Candidatus Saccharicenans subterraneus]|uniref:Uncharacterized protein n=1 Tax=Candidatus Saccharicenans subterraneus TaxID=2508984 RepID=A0A3E2BLU0_9BACT|nr:MAG: hypothetical protein OP8BY_0039 [Candidatus Saccharicenans subterraneum]